MFTGIVQSIGTVLSVKTKNSLSQIVIEVENEHVQNVALGASIAINGVCLTVVACHQYDDRHSHISFDVIDETLRVTNLGDLASSERVNFERSLKVGDELGGHMVSGHIHCQARLTNKTQSAENTCLTFELVGLESELDSVAGQKYLFDKGFVAINGVSLTLGKVVKHSFNVHLIPETLQRTNLDLVEKDACVNIEFDQQTITIVNTIERLKLATLS